MTNGRKPPATLPRTANLPPATHNINPMLEEYAGEAARAAQRYFEMSEQINKLTEEADEWRRRAMMAEEELKRATRREEALNIKLESTADRLTAERDTYRDRLVTLKAEFATAGNIILNCLKVSEEMISAGERQVTHEQLEKLADDLEGERMPSVVTAGPREN
jgi:chromosome segregation ATPase